MTVAQFYHRTVVEGRATVRGHDSHPVVWVTRPGKTDAFFCLCFKNRIALRFLRGDTETSKAFEGLDQEPEW